jgi:hypothetical protein
MGVAAIEHSGDLVSLAPAKSFTIDEIYGMGELPNDLEV